MAPQGRDLKLQDIIHTRLKIDYFQIASSARGRGVLRLLLIKQQMNLVCVPAIVLQLLMVASPSMIMPPAMCIILETLYITALTDHNVGHFTVASGR